MQPIILPGTATIMETDFRGSFAVEPLHPGYASTLGNALRRVLLSSMEGAAADSIEITGVTHEFSTLPGITEDATEILLNVKQLRFRLFADRAEMVLTKKGPGVATGADFAPNADCEVMSPSQVVATLSNGADFEIRVVVSKGRGYEPVEHKGGRERTVGIIAVDSIYSPVTAVSYRIENTRVGQMTNYDKLLLEITTDGSLKPSEALREAASILTQQYAAISGLSELPAAEVPEEDGETIVFEEGGFDILHPIDAKTKIEDAGLTGRTVHSLSAAGFKTLSGLKRLSDIKLQSIKGLGTKGFEEVKAVLGRVD